jgi:hypothetical protein
VIKVGVTMPADFTDAAEFLADVQALEAAGAELIEVEGAGEAVLGGVAAVTHRMRMLVADPERASAVRKLSRGRVIEAVPEGETWTAVAMPADRTAWAAMLHEQEAAGATGVLVPWDQRLIDLLRNPEPEDRSDLLMSTG